MLPANYQCEGQMSIFDFLPQPQFGKTSPEHSAQELPKEETLDVSSRNWQESKNLKFQFLCLTSGCHQDVLEEIIGLSHGEPTMHNIGEFRSEEKGYVSLPDSMIQMQTKFSFNCSEKPTLPRPSKLSQILEVNPDPKYHLSPKACLGILRRAEGKGKKLPELLEKTLRVQSGLIISDDPKEEGDVTTYPIEGNGARPSHHGPGYSDGAMYTLNAVEHHSVCIGNGQFHDAISPSDEVSKTLNCMCDPMKVVVEPILLESNQNHATVQTDGVCTALPASMGMGGGYVPMITEKVEEKPPALAIDRAAYNQGQNAQYNFSVEEELAQTLVAKGPGGVMQTQ